MAKLPIITPRISPRQVTGPRRANLEPIAEQDPVSGVLISAGAQIAEVAFKKIQQAEVSNLAVQMTDFDTKMSLLEKEMSRKAIPDQEGGLFENPQGDKWDDEFIEKFNTDLNAIGENAKTPVAAAQFQEYKARANARFSLRLADSRQKIAGQKALLKASKLVQDLSVDAYNSPEEFEVLNDGFKLTLANMVESDALTDLAAAEIYQDKIQDIAISAAQGQIDTDLNGAKKDIKAGRYDDFIDGKTKNTLMDGVNAKIEALKNKDKNLQTLIVKKPYKAAAKMGTHPGPIQLTTEGVMDRQQWRKAYKKSFGVMPPLLDEVETLKMIGRFKSLNARDSIELMSSYAENFPPEVMSDIGKAIAPKDPSMAIVAMEASSSPQEMTRVLTGRKLRNENAIKLDDEGAMRAHFDTQIAVNILRNQPKLRSAFIDATMDHYTAIMTEKGLNATIFRRDIFNESVNAIMGPTVNHNNVRSLSFKDEDGVFVRPSEFRNDLNKLNDELIQKIQGETPKDSAGRNFNFDSDRVTLHGAANGEYFVKLDGEAFVFNDLGAELAAKTAKANKGKAAKDRKKPKYEPKHLFRLKMKAVHQFFKDNENVGVTELSKGNIETGGSLVGF